MIAVLYVQEQQALLKSSGNAAETGTMKSLTRAQEATGKAHITVQVGYVEILLRWN